jgi:hypothetical protein
MEVTVMHAKRKSADELIMECRSSGMTDYQWCNEHNNTPGTFYNVNAPKLGAYVQMNYDSSIKKIAIIGNGFDLAHGFIVLAFCSKI